MVLQCQLYIMLYFLSISFVLLHVVFWYSPLLFTVVCESPFYLFFCWLLTCQVSLVIKNVRLRWFEHWACGMLKNAQWLEQCMVIGTRETWQVISYCIVWILISELCTSYKLMIIQHGMICDHKDSRYDNATIQIVMDW